MGFESSIFFSIFHVLFSNAPCLGFQIFSMPFWLPFFFLKAWGVYLIFKVLESQKRTAPFEP